MSCEDVYKNIINREDMRDIPVLILIKVSIATFEEMIKLEKEAYYVDEFQP